MSQYVLMYKFQTSFFSHFFSALHGEILFETCTRLFQPFTSLRWRYSHVEARPVRLVRESPPKQPNIRLSTCSTCVSGGEVESFTRGSGPGGQDSRRDGCL